MLTGLSIAIAKALEDLHVQTMEDAVLEDLLTHVQRHLYHMEVMSDSGLSHEEKMELLAEYQENECGI